MRRTGPRGLSPGGRLVLVAGVAATLLKLYLAWTTLGTNDVRSFIDFAAGVDQFGPVGIYGEPFLTTYNHGPFTGWLLVLANFLQDAGIGLPFLIRVPASLGDLVTSWLVFRLLAESNRARVAVAAAVGVVWSPVLLVVSGYHGNTDPLFVMLTVSSFYLLTRGGRPLLGGVCMGLACSVKLVPFVALPWLLYLAWRAGRVKLLRFLTGGGTVALLLWVPVIMTRWSGFRESVLSYRGIGLREWGLPELIERLGAPGVENWLAAHGWYALVIAASVAFLGMRVHGGDVIGFGLTLVTMLVLSPAFGMQYLSWPLAAAYLVSVRSAWFYNVAASILVIVVYSDWSDTVPWSWEIAFATPFTVGQLLLAAIVWAFLLIVALDGVGALFRGWLPAPRVVEHAASPQDRV